MTPTQIEAIIRKKGDILSIIEVEVGSSTMKLVREVLEKEEEMGSSTIKLMREVLEIERILSLEENK